MDRMDNKRIQVLGALEALWHHQNGQTIVTEQVMTATPVCVGPETTLPELVAIFHERHFRHLLVVDDAGRLQGVISDRDVLRMMGPGTAYKEVLEGILAGELMSTDLVTAEPRTPVTDAIVTMIDHGISCLPVVSEGRLLGIMTNTDLHVLLQMLLQALRTTGPEQSLTAGPR
jgi:acetoin utilization protein AcuB